MAPRDVLAGLGLGWAGVSQGVPLPPRPTHHHGMMPVQPALRSRSRHPLPLLRAEGELRVRAACASHATALLG